MVEQSLALHVPLHCLLLVLTTRSYRAHAVGVLLSAKTRLHTRFSQRTMQRTDLSAIPH